MRDTQESGVGSSKFRMREAANNYIGEAEVCPLSIDDLLVWQYRIGEEMFN